MFNCSDGVVLACLNLISQMLTEADFRLSLSIQQYFSTAHAMQSQVPRKCQLQGTISAFPFRENLCQLVFRPSYKFRNVTAQCL